MRGQLHGEVTWALREVILQLARFNRHVGGNLDLKDVDLACFNLIERHGPKARGISRYALGCIQRP